MQTTYTGIGESLLFILILFIILSIVCFFARFITRRTPSKTLITKERKNEEKIRIKEGKEERIRIERAKKEEDRRSCCYKV